MELTVVVRDDVRPWRVPPTEDFLYGEWERAAYEAGELPARRPNPDLAPLLTMVLAAGRAAFGPPPATLLDPVPPDDLVRAVVAGIPGLLADLDDDTRNVLLTLARILVTVESGEIVAKDEAGGPRPAAARGAGAGRPGARPGRLPRPGLRIVRGPRGGRPALRGRADPGDRRGGFLATRLNRPGSFDSPRSPLDTSSTGHTTARLAAAAPPPLPEVPDVDPHPLARPEGRRTGPL